MENRIRDDFERLYPAVDYCSLRVVRRTSERLHVRRNVQQPISRDIDIGLMVCVMHAGGLGYAATSDISAAGIRWAIDRAVSWAHTTKHIGVFDFRRVAMSQSRGEYRSAVRQPWDSVSFSDKFALLHDASRALQIDDEIVDWGADVSRVRQQQWLFTHIGGVVYQDIERVKSNVYATAYAAGESQHRSLAGGGIARQGGWETVLAADLLANAPRVASEARMLLHAPNCPAGNLDIVLAPDQMMLQIHESIGHPLELDRILGDERNYAGTSFVTLDMFGEYRYGSDLLTVSFDPGVTGELASYAFDDDGTPAERCVLIEKGILLRPLGGTVAQTRAQFPGVANARAESWNRPPIDRMANLNVEPGNQSFAEIIGAVENGIYMASNRSWSIDDSRNKFQFGCEWAQLIKDGELGGVVKNPNYRGVSAEFWRSLDGVGNAQSWEIHGTPFCGKGEMNQVITVGHAAPPCLFRNVDVFGGG